MKLHQLIEQHWQQPKIWLRPMLRPFSYLFGTIARIRRQCYLSGSLKHKRLPVPVAVVGNIHVGGTGKTPISSLLIRQLQQRGVAVGVISRGYGRSETAIHLLNDNSTAAQAGDEPLMLHRQTRAPIAVGSDRYATGMALLNAHPALQIIIADDGLQHYALARDIEICVFPASDAARQNELDVLPNGNLREALHRLHDVDIIVLSNVQADTDIAALNHFGKPIFCSRIQIGAPYRFNNPAQTLSSGSLKTHETCAAIAAIARPERFFNSVQQLGFKLAETRALPDHADIKVADLPQVDYVLLTEKDAAKLPPSAPDNIWVVPIEAAITPDLAAHICQLLQLQTKA